MNKSIKVADKKIKQLRKAEDIRIRKYFKDNAEYISMFKPTRTININKEVS